MRVLIVEDEVRLAKALKQILEQEKYMVDMVHDGNDAIDYATAEEDLYDIIILDVMLPGKNGYEIARFLRNEKIKTPIIMLTAKSGVKDKVVGLDCGADDYMTKPFSPEELLARVRALTRRQGEVVLDKMDFGDLTLNIATSDLICKNKSIHLNYKEFEVLKLLISNPKTAVTKDSLITKVWGYDSEATDNNVEAYISFLRKKLLYLNSTVTITALRKIGYKIEVK